MISQAQADEIKSKREINKPLKFSKEFYSLMEFYKRFGNKIITYLQEKQKRFIHIGETFCEFNPLEERN